MEFDSIKLEGDMRHYILTSILVFTLFHSIPALGLDAAASGECQGTIHSVHVSGYYIEEIGGEIVDGDISGIVFKCEAIGICEPSFFSPPLPFDPQPNPQGGFPEYYAEYSIEPPLSGVAYRYTPYGVRPDGTLVSTMHHCDADSRSYALVGCEDTPIARGVFVIDGNSGGDLLFGIQNCGEDCWTEYIGTYLGPSAVQELSGQPWESLLGRVVDIFGTRTYCAMPGGDYHVITRIELSEGGACGPVPTQIETWSGLKAQYR
jgi:hypothetical protein